MPRQKGFSSLFIIGISTLLVLVGIFFIYKSNKQATVSLAPEPSVPLQNGNQSLVPTLDLEKQISLKIPDGWKKEVIYDDVLKYSVIKITSADYQSIASYNWPGLVIEIRKEISDGQTPTIEDEYKLIYDEIHNPNPIGATSQNLKKITIAGYNGLYSEYTFEGYEQDYSLWAGDDIWRIRIYSSSKLVNEKHEKEINSILSSIKIQ